MITIKLDAIDSTNDFLKELIQKQNVANFTVVTAKKQTKGKGQMGARWHTEESKNLITSILIKDTLSKADAIFDLNIATALSIITTLKKLEIPDLSIKWPNDIMSGNKKIAGILIENIFRENHAILSVVGIGLNVNQTNFEDLPKASSLKNIVGKDFQIETIVETIAQELQEMCEKIKENNSSFLWKNYHDWLFKIGKPIAFENEKQGRFMGIIQRVLPNGQLEVLLEEDRIATYGIKEITMLY